MISSMLSLAAAPLRPGQAVAVGVLVVVGAPRLKNGHLSIFLTTGIIRGEKLLLLQLITAPLHNHPRHQCSNTSSSSSRSRSSTTSSSLKSTTSSSSSSIRVMITTSRTRRST